MRASLVSRPWVGLDLGGFGAKLFALQPSMGTPRLLAAEAAYPVTAAADGAPSPEAVAQAISACAARAGVSLCAMRGISVGISGADVVVKQIQVQLMDEVEVGQAPRFEARKHLPFDPQAIATTLQVPFEKAEELKLVAGSDEPGFRADWTGRELQAAHEALEDGLVDELRRSLAFDRTLGRLPDPLRLQLSGGTARLPGIAGQRGSEGPGLRIPMVVAARSGLSARMAGKRTMRMIPAHHRRPARHLCLGSIVPDRAAAHSIGPRSC